MTKHEYFMTFDAFFISIRNYDHIIFKISNNYEQKSLYNIRAMKTGQVHFELTAL